MTFLIPVLIVVWNVLILVLERAPAVEVVPEIVKFFNLLFRAIVVTQLRNRLVFAESTFGFKDRAPRLEEALLLSLFFGRRFNTRSLVNGVELTAFYWVKKDFGGFLDAFEE